MSFDVSQEHEQVREVVSRFAAEEIAPLASDADDSERFPREIFSKSGELDLLGVRYPVDDGGAGMDKVSDCIVREELSYVSQAFAAIWSARAHLCTWTIWKIGTNKQKDHYVKPALSGQKISCFVLNDPGAGSNVRGLTTKAEKIDGSNFYSVAITTLSN